MEVDVYDFDKTVVPFDSALKYWGFCMVHNPWIMLLVPIQFIWGMMMLTHIISVKTCKKIAFASYMPFINNEKNVQKYWDKYESKVFDWFKPENRERPAVLISASPDFLIDEIAKRLKVEYVICSKHDPKSGILLGEVCRKEEKVVRFKQELPDVKVINVYSDSLEHDRYIFALGENCYLVNKGVMKKFDFSEVSK